MTLTPPLQLAWRKDTQFVTAVAGNDSLYGITPSGKIQALRASDGARRWESQGSYLTDHLLLQGSRLLAFRIREGLTFIDDTGTLPVETLVASFTATLEASISTPVVNDSWIYYVVNQGFYALHQEHGLQYGIALSDLVPHTIGLLPNGDLLCIDGKGTPTRYRATGSNFDIVWRGSPNGVNAGQRTRPFAISENQLVISVGLDLFAYDLTSGNATWRLANVPALALTSIGELVYGAFHGASLWCVRATDGAMLWQRQYIYDVSLQREFGLHMKGEYLYFGGRLQGNPDKSILMAVRASNGDFTWLSRSVSRAWAGGLAISDSQRLFSFGGEATGAYVNLPRLPSVSASDVEVSPRPLRGPALGFGSSEVNLTMPVAAKISVTAYRESKGLGRRIINDENLSIGTRKIEWTVNDVEGFSDSSQFGYILVDVEEAGGLAYTQSVLLPINSFPDILTHWARHNIETMVYHKYVGGYPDQMFRPDGLVNRAETSSIIAKTLGLEAPGPSFAGTKFTDIASHWARNYIMALEERNIITGFLEQDGRYTFRPNLNMTRGQEARILIRAYAIPSAPVTFVSKFTDIDGHWAVDDIRALEASGYVQGFREMDGTYTYRPEQNLSRAELCTVVVRIRKLTR